MLNDLSLNFSLVFQESLFSRTCMHGNLCWQVVDHARTLLSYIMFCPNYEGQIEVLLLVSQKVLINYSGSSKLFIIYLKTMHNLYYNNPGFYSIDKM